MTWLQMMDAKWPEITARYPATKRFQNQGFELDPRYHAENCLGLRSENQVITLNLVTFDFEQIEGAR